MSASTLDLGVVKTWAKAQEKQFRELKKQLVRSENLAEVLKKLSVDDPGMRTFRNRARKLQREFPAPTRFRSKVMREVDGELKRYSKLLALM